MVAYTVDITGPFPPKKKQVTQWRWKGAGIYDVDVCEEGVLQKQLFIGLKFCNITVIFHSRYFHIIAIVYYVLM